MQSIIILWFYMDWWTLVRVLGFSPRVWLYEVPNHQFKCCEVFLDGIHVGFLRYYGMEKLYEEMGTKRGKNVAFLGKTTRWYRYQNRVVPVPPYRTHLVPVPRQVVPVPPYRMCLVLVPNIVVPVPQCPKAQIFVVSRI